MGGKSKDPLQVYIAGPIVGDGKLETIQANLLRFHDAAYRLRHVGHVPVNPAELDTTLYGYDGMTTKMPAFMTRRRVLMVDFLVLSECGAIYLLKHWDDQSTGARAEFAFAVTLSLRIAIEEGARHPTETGLWPDWLPYEGREIDLEV